MFSLKSVIYDFKTLDSYFRYTFIGTEYENVYQEFVV